MGISVCQRKYALELFSDVEYLGYRPSSIPMEPNLKISQEIGDILTEAIEYRRLVEKLIYITIMRPDLS